MQPILFASPQTWDLIGLSASEELVGRCVLDYVIEDERCRLALRMSQVTTEVGLSKNSEYTVVGRNGATVPAESSFAVIRDSEGQPKALMAVIRDITERKQAQEALEREHRTLKHLLQSSDHERQTIAYDIHDGLAQQIAASIMQFQMFDHLKDTKPEDAAKAHEAGLAMLRQSHFEARRLISGVRPPILDESGIVAAIAHLVHDQGFDHGPKIEFRSKVTFHRLTPIVENAIYRIVQEGVTNAWKHSKSEKVKVSLSQHGEKVRVEIRDWGVGFDPNNVDEGHFGLEGMRQRVRLLGGQFTIDSTPGKGTRIVVKLPILPQEG